MLLLPLLTLLLPLLLPPLTTLLPLRLTPLLPLLLLLPTLLLPQLTPPLPLWTLLLPPLTLLLPSKHRSATWQRKLPCSKKNRLGSFKAVFSCLWPGKTASDSGGGRRQALQVRRSRLPAQHLGALRAMAGFQFPVAQHDAP